jgi:hypothetical protein
MFKRFLAKSPPLTLLLAFLLIASACGQSTQPPTATMAPPPTAEPTSTPMPTATSTPTSTPKQTAMPEPTAITSPEANLGEEASIDPLEIGDPDRGRDIVWTGGGVMREGCGPACHSFDGIDMLDYNGDPAAPSLLGISTRAGTRVNGMSAVDYIRQSIIDPEAYIVEGYGYHRMPVGFEYVLSEKDINNLIAFLLTQ